MTGRWLICGSLLLAAVRAEAQFPLVRVSHGKVARRCVLGPYDYFPHPGAGLSTGSEPGILLQAKGLTGADNGTRAYQSAATQVRVGHCRLSDMAVATCSDGYWLVSFRAEQNPRIGPDGDVVDLTRRRAHPTVFQTADIKRNQFHVTVRGLGAAPAGVDTNPAAPRAGKPALVQIDLPPFWVENGEPDLKRFSGVSAELARFQGQIDRFEIELRYR